MCVTNTIKDLVKKYLDSDVNAKEFELIFNDNNSINLIRFVSTTNKYPILNDLLEEYLKTCDNIDEYSNGWTALHFSIHNYINENAARTVELLINSGANVNLQSNIHKCTPLHLAARVYKMANKDKNKNKNKKNMKRIIKLLIQADADVFNLLDSDNNPPIYYFTQELIEYCQIDKDTQTIGIKTGSLTKAAKK